MFLRTPFIRVKGFPSNHKFVHTNGKKCPVTVLHEAGASAKAVLALCQAVEENFPQNSKPQPPSSRETPTLKLQNHHAIFELCVCRRIEQLLGKNAVYAGLTALKKSK